ncbi:hypothetical protein GCM10023317_96160 [Actinopolymorpha pittospori]
MAREYGVSQGRVSRLLARYRAEGQAAFEPRSRRPNTSPTAVKDATVELIVRIRKELSEQGLDAGPATIARHLQHCHHLRVSSATISRYRTRDVHVNRQIGHTPETVTGRCGDVQSLQCCGPAKTAAWTSLRIKLSQ